LESIKDFISQDSAKYAETVVKDIVALGESLADFPLSGKAVEEFPRLKLRERQVYSYRLVYRVKRGAVEIATVSHQSRKLKVK